MTSWPGRSTVESTLRRARWLAGGGVKPGITYGETDDYCYNAAILRCLGIDHTQLTFKYQGRHFRLTDVHGVVKKEILA